MSALCEKRKSYDDFGVIDVERQFSGERTPALDTVVNILIALDMRLVVKPSPSVQKKPRTMPGP
jgi:hypothetical protein